MRKRYLVIATAWLLQTTSWFLPAVKGFLGSRLDHGIPGWAVFLSETCALDLAGLQLDPDSDTSDLSRLRQNPFPAVHPWRCSDTTGDAPETVTTRSIGAADALQVPLVCFAAFENHFCGHEQQCAGACRGTFSTDNPLKFSQEVRVCGLHGRLIERVVEDIKVTGGRYRRSGFRPLTRMCTVAFFEFPH